MLHMRSIRRPWLASAPHSVLRVRCPRRLIESRFSNCHIHHRIQASPQADGEPHLRRTRRYESEKCHRLKGHGRIGINGLSGRHSRSDLRKTTKCDVFGVVKNMGNDA